MKKIFVLVALTAILSACKDSGDPNVTNGTNFYNNQQYDEAIAEYRLALGKDLRLYKKEEVYTYIGAAFEESERYDSAIYYHKKALEINPEYVDALINLGITYRMTTEYDLAEDCYTKALKLEPSNANLLTSLGALYISKDLPELAIPYLEKSIEIAPETVVSHSNYAIALAMVGSFNAAEREIIFAEEHGYEQIDNLKERITELKTQSAHDEIMKNESMPSSED